MPSFLKLEELVVLVELMVSILHTLIFKEHWSLNSCSHYSN